MILPIGVTKKNNAFTFVEILLVIVILAVLLALASPNFSKGYSRFQLNQTADDLLATSRWAQAMAIGQERPYVLIFADDRRSYHFVRAVVNDGTDDQSNFEPVNGSLGKEHSLPNGISLNTDHDRIQFYPNGTIDQVMVQLSSPGHKMVLSSSEVSGMMTKVDDE